MADPVLDGRQRDLALVGKCPYCEKGERLEARVWIIRP